ncbi:hypothetical protein ACFJGX_11085 [Hydrogenophaga sp. UC242_50]|uniref:hypothetical protein n=1 Tax=unclassified Hydrogenophaga TaxID=2610897 RepID=UPI0036D3BC5D
MNWTEDIPNLKIQRLDNGNLRLEDKSFSEGAIVDVHPSQLRLMAERLGLVRELSASDADLLRAERALSTSLRQELERLVPWLVLIEARSAQLHENIMGVSMRGNEDVNIEVAQSSALADIAEEVCNDAKAAVARCLAHGADRPATSTGTQQSRKTPIDGRAQEPGSSVATASGALQAALI